MHFVVNASHLVGRAVLAISAEYASKAGVLACSESRSAPWD